MLNVYLCISTITFAVLTLLWSSRTWLNLAIKIVLFFLTGSGVVLFLISLGLVIKS